MLFKVSGTLPSYYENTDYFIPQFGTAFCDTTLSSLNTTPTLVPTTTSEREKILVLLHAGSEISPMVPVGYGIINNQKYKAHQHLCCI